VCKEEKRKVSITVDVDGEFPNFSDYVFEYDIDKRDLCVDIEE
jgi:hypothetical protein